MSDYFDYIMKESTLPESYDIDDVITESDLALMEFDSYVQEGVGMKILIGIGLAALIGGLIAVLVKMLSNSSSTSSSVAIKQAKKSVELAKKYGVKSVRFGGFKQGWLSSEGIKHIEEVCKCEDITCDMIENIIGIISSTDDNSYEKNEFNEKLKTIFDDMMSKVKDANIVDTFSVIEKHSTDEVLETLSERKGFIDYGEQGVEKSIEEIDQRLIVLDNCQKDAKKILNRLTKCKQKVQELLKTKPNLVKNETINGLCKEFEPSIVLMEGVHNLTKKSADSITRAIDTEKTINRLAGM